MRHVLALAWLLGTLTAVPLAAQEPAPPPPDPLPPPAEVSPDQEPAWETVWGVADLRVIPAGPRVAPNGQEYHPNFDMGLDSNLWLWHSQRLYLFADLSFWGETGENGVTNRNDGFLGTSKREFDLSGGVAWNYAGPWEARAFGYSYNNLNRGTSPTAPAGFNDGFGVENRLYLSSEYAELGTTGFDVTQATFVSVGYYPNKEMVGNDGQLFKPGAFARAYLTCDLWDWPAYLFGDVAFIADNGFHARLLLFDLGLAARPFSACPQLEFRLGADSVADFQVGDVKSLGYGSVRYVF
jgi:hypothetical protein